MVNTMISIPGYVHLYRSLLRFYDMPENEVREMLYLLNTANLDCYEYYHPDRSVIQSGPVAFCGWLETKENERLPPLPHRGTALQIAAVFEAQH